MQGMESMEGLTLGMFVAGLVMSAAPIALGIWIVVFLLREMRRSPGGPATVPGSDDTRDGSFSVGESP
jgi:hypothetical protein